MNQTEATHLIRDVFEQPFDEARFTRFVRELLNEIDESKGFRMTGQYIPASFREHVRQYRRIATYTDPDGEAVDILVVQLKQATALERARTMQRNFVAYYLKTRGEKDAALVAYHGDDRADWRFSLVRMDYRLRVDGDSGKVKVEEDLTPARRYSFLVGQHEPNHTAQQQLFPLLADDRRNPTLADLESAFDIETVTREFFGRYKELFVQVRDELEDIAARDGRVRAEFQARGIDSGTFAKKLLGQIVFLYFLQKKGWLGVAPGEPWGSGPRDFLRQLFQGRWRRTDNFFEKLLEPLFYAALAVERPDNLYPPLRCRIPFLNGGLFEPVGGYDWEGCPIPLANATIGAIFDAFDLYNFTVREDEPLEKEVAVDPEMLGKVFENLLEVGDRKSKGAFYTPREIVHYMCQEALIHYLDAALNLRPQPLVDPAPEQGLLFGSPPPRQASLPSSEMVYEPRVSKEDIERFIRQGELAVEHETAREEGASSYKRRLPAAVAEHAAALDAALAGVKVCDPAIGSGAFPVGVMQEIVRGRLVLNAYLGEGPERTAYAFKRHAIQESIYGVDIDPSAVDIAKLRLWLSLVVDEDDYLSIKPLPNLGYKIVCGNSLLSVQKDLFNQHLFARIEELKEQYFVETSRPAKQAQSREIDALIGQLTHAAGQFDYEVYFSEVFRAQDGFDVVIGNPPYVRQELIREHKPALKAHFPEVYQGTADLYVYFYAKGLRLLRPHGVLVYISSNKFMRAGYGERLRSHLSQKATLQTVIDFGDLPVFDATTYPCILVLTRSTPKRDHDVHTLTVDSMEVLFQLPAFVSQSSWEMPQSNFAAQGWTLDQPDVLRLIKKIKRAGQPLKARYAKYSSGIKTGLNQAFVIDERVRQRLVDQDPSCQQVIKPWVQGKDIRRWHVDWRSSYFILLQNSGDEDATNPWGTAKTEREATAIFKSTYPAIYNHLRQYEDALRKRQDQGRYWWELRSCVYYKDFTRPKIFWPDIAKECRFAFDAKGLFGGNTLYVLPTDDVALLAVLNSPVIEFFYRQISSTIQNDYLRFIAQYMELLPIPEIDDAMRRELEPRVRRLLELAGQGPEARRLEDEVNQMVYRLFDLTAEEIELIESQLKGKTEVA
ncbi:MAG: TaqI-like C-terminal specificity domain-containing protein [Anaerolineae bacterium]